MRRPRKRAVERTVSVREHAAPRGRPYLPRKDPGPSARVLIDILVKRSILSIPRAFDEGF